MKTVGLVACCMGSVLINTLIIHMTRNQKRIQALEEDVEELKKTLHD